jgi:hypothetical protein
MLCLQLSSPVVTLREILYTDSQDMLVLSSTVVSRYYNCCTDSSTSLGNYGYPSNSLDLSREQIPLQVLHISTEINSKSTRRSAVSRDCSYRRPTQPVALGTTQNNSSRRNAGRFCWHTQQG